MRHGQTDWNKANRLQGQLDVPLDEQGLEQATQVAERLKAISLDVICSSPLLRALTTAEAIAAFHPIVVLTDKRLMERHYGQLQGEHGEQWKQDPAYRQHAEGLEADQLGYRLPQGESYHDVESRVAAFHAELLNQQPKGARIVVVTHNWVKRAYCKLLLNWTPEQMLSERFGNTAVTTMRLSLEGKAQLEDLNCLRHLESSPHAG